jgi:poly-gamma-glutamate capsule biosynthesis protein CapA/YwtB (metallophosphatase superfamily)
MKLQDLPILVFSILLLASGCKVKPPTSSDKTQKDKEPSDTVQIHANPLPDDVTQIEIFPFRPDTISIIGVGDMMLGTNFPDEKYLPPDSGKYLLEDVTDILRSADLTFGNLEGVILDSGGDPKNCKNPDICYLFRSPEFILNHIHDAGFDVVSTANNHAGDFGEPGRENTARVLDSLGIRYAGSLHHPFTIFEKGKIRYGFAAFAPNKGTPIIGDLESAKSTIAHLDSLSDIVIVSFHGGGEGKDYMHVTRETEFFYGENRGNVYEFSHELIDAGADIIFGHGPHVPRAVEVYKDRFIAYSLGNFCTYARFNLRGENAYAPIVKVYVSHEGVFQTGEIISAIQTGLGVPIIDDKHRAAGLIRSLTQEDFKEAKIVIGDSGVITYIEE